MIKRLLQVGIILAGFASMPSWAYTIGGTIDVGGLDTLVQTATKTAGDPLSLTNLPSSGEQTEIDWVNLVLGTSFASNNYKVQNASFSLVDGSNSVYASALNLTPSTAIANYFIVKNAKYWALFDNQLEMGWAVFDATGLPSGMNYDPANDPWIISHLTVFADADVPEPSVLALMGLGLLGFGFKQRRKLH